MAADDPLHLGSWERVRVLGAGGFGTVTLWKNKITQEKVAIKKYRSNSSMTKTVKERWAREVDIMQRLSHLNVVRGLSVPADLRSLVSELPLLCMEFCSGGDLRQILNKPENCCGLREAEVRCLLSDIKSAVQYLHTQRITHRDLKPENIVLQERPNYPVVYKLIDLGYAKELESTSLCSSFVGTMQYLAPEFFTSSRYSSSVDYWSLGLVSHEVITGMRPFLPNSVSPVEWLPNVEKKSSNDICVYEVPGSAKEIKYSQQLFVENYISRCLREELEKWLRVALEFDPKKRGRTQADLVIFSLLDEILSKKIVTVFSVLTLSCHSFQVDSATAVSTLQMWIERDTKQPVGDQLLLLPSGKQLTLNHLAIHCWNLNEMTMLYVFSQTSLSLPTVKVADRVPGLVRWLMEHPKEALEYHHQKHVWRHAVFFLRQEHELYQLFLEAYAVKMLSLLDQSCELAQLESAVTSELEQLGAMQKMSSDTLEFDNKCYSRHLTTYPSLVGVSKQIAGWATEVNSLAQRVASYREAMTAMALRVQEAQTHTGLLQEYRDPGQDDLTALEGWLKEGYKCYDNLRKRKDQTSQYPSMDMARIVYNCFKQIDITLRNDSFAAHLKQLMCCEAEMRVLTKALTVLKQQVSRSKQEVMRSQYIRQKEMWVLVKRLATLQKEHDTRRESTLSLNIPPTPGTTVSPSTSPPSASPMPFEMPPPPRNPSPLPQRESQIPLYASSLSVSQENGLNFDSKSQLSYHQPISIHQATTSTTTPKSTASSASSAFTTVISSSTTTTVPSTSTTPPSSDTTSTVISANFDTSLRQVPLTNTPTMSSSMTKSVLVPSSALESDSLILENINIRYAMQDSLVSFTQCSNMIANNDFDWSYLDVLKK